MEIIKTGTFVSSDYYSTENSPLRSVPRYELELYLGGEGFSVINGVKYPHADEGGSTHFLLARPGDKRFSIRDDRGFASGGDDARDHGPSGT